MLLYFFFFFHLQCWWNGHRLRPFRAPQLAAGPPRGRSQAFHIETGHFMSPFKVRSRLSGFFQNLFHLCWTGAKRYLFFHFKWSHYSCHFCISRTVKLSKTSHLLGKSTDLSAPIWRLLKMLKHTTEYHIMLDWWTLRKISKIQGQVKSFEESPLRCKNQNKKNILGQILWGRTTSRSK